MADDVFRVTVRGVQDAAAELRALVPKLRKRAIANSLRAGARLIRDDQRANAPVLSVPVRRKGRLIRKPGTVRDAISVRTSRSSARSGNIGVFVNVKPARGANRGRYNPFDPFYWRFLVRSSGRMLVAIRASAGKLPQALAKVEASLGAVIKRLNTPKAPAP